MEAKHGAVNKSGKKKLTFFNFPFSEKSIIVNKLSNEIKLQKLKSAEEVFLL